jgi:hypothetical protein
MGRYYNSPRPSNLEDAVRPALVPSLLHAARTLSVLAWTGAWCASGAAPVPATWEHGGRVVASPGHAPAMAPDGTGGVFVAWVETDGDSTRVRVRRLNSEGEAPGWPVGGLVAVDWTAGIDRIGIGADGEGGFTLVWTIQSLQARLLRCLPDGTLAPGHAAGGRALCFGGMFAFDHTGHLAVVRGAPDFRLLSLNRDGDPLPGWSQCGVSGVEDQTYTTYQPKPPVPDGHGGMFVSYGFIVNWPGSETRYFGDGRMHASAEGTLVHGDLPDANAEDLFHGDFAGGAYQSVSHRIEHVGAGLELQSQYQPPQPGAFVWDIAARAETAFVAYAHTGLPVLKLVNGAVAPGWLPGGNPATGSTDPWPQEARVVGDGWGGVFVAWRHTSEASGYPLMQHLAADGDPKAHWEPDGNVLADTPDPIWPELCADGEGGVYVLWARAGAVRLQHVPGEHPLMSASLESASMDRLVGPLMSPTSTDPIVRFDLASAGPARLELIDVMGRIVGSRDVHALGVGRHEVALHLPRRIPGLYFVRLTTDRVRQTARVVVHH